MTTALTTALFSILLPLSEGNSAVEPSLTASVPPAAVESSASIHSATRMRKLHLVRPDLIPYPLAYEIYC